MKFDLTKVPTLKVGYCPVCNKELTVFDDMAIAMAPGTNKMVIIHTECLK